MKKKMDPAEALLSKDYTYVVAELGKSFIQSSDDRPISEYLENAYELVDAAVESGADAVKFQTHELEDEQLDIEIISPHFKGSDRYSWVKRNMDATPVKEFWVPLFDYCKKKGITYFSTPMTRKAAMKLQDNFNVPFWKVGSGDVTDKVLLNYLISTKKPIIISTGMVSLDELDEIVKYITGNGSPLVVLYCVSQYPCPLEHFNLASIEYLTEKYPDVVIGFSDHSVDSNDVDLAAAKLGARVIEKHFSLDRGLWGSDHKASVLPHEMKQLIDDIRAGKHLEIDETPFYGDRERELEGAKNMFRPYFHKALMAGADLPKGTVITEEHVFAMRPLMYAKGLHASKLESVLGKKLKKALKKYDPITEDLLS